MCVYVEIIDTNFFQIIYMYIYIYTLPVKII